MLAEINKVKDFILKHCERKAKEQGVEKKDIQVRFSLSAPCGCDLIYHTCNNYKSFEKTDFHTICNFKLGIDFFGYSEKVPPLILHALNYLCKKNNIEVGNLYVFACPDENYYTQEEDSDVRKKELIAIHVFNGGKWIERMSVQEFVLSNILTEGLA